MLESVKRGNPRVFKRSGSVGQSLYQFEEGFSVTSQAVWLDVIDGKFGQSIKLRVFAYLASQCKRDNRLMVTQAHVAKQLGAQRSHVSEAFKSLREDGYLIRMNEGGMDFWYLDSRRTFRGSADRHAASLAKQRKARDKGRKVNVVALRADQVPA